MTQTHKHSVPALRFPEFNRGWLSKPFGSFAVKVKESYNPSKSSKDWPCIELESLGKESGQILQTFRAKDLQSIKTKFETGDILFGKLRPYLKKYALVDFNGVCTSEIWVLRASDISGPFLYYIVQSSKFNQYANIQSGSKMPRSDWNIVSSATHFLPPLIPEQQKIASFLSSVDGKIEQLGSKKSLLEQYKKGMTQRLFSQELRFKDAKGNDFPDWEETTIGELGHFYYGKSAPKFSLSPDAPTPCVRYGELYSKYGMVIEKVESKTNIDPKNLRFSKGGEILVPRVGEDPQDFATCCYLTLKDVAIGEMISVFNTNQNGLFYTYYFRTLVRQFARVVEGASVSNLYYSYLEPIKIGKPHLEEQQKIADFLSSIDQKIDLVSTELDHAKTFKKGLLQQMFI